MKFSHSIQFNAVPDWSSHYIAYSNLKKLIYTLEKKVVQSGAKSSATDPERSALLGDDVDTDAVFRRALDAELEKIIGFYEKKEDELLKEVLQLLKDAEEYDLSTAEFADPNPYKGRQLRSSASSGFERWGASTDVERVEDGDDSDDDDNGPDGGADGANDRLLRGGSQRSANPNMHASILSEAPSDMTFRRRASVAYSEDGDPYMDTIWDKRITLKKRAISLFVALRELKSYSQLNRTGFSKALKKYDKILQRNLKVPYIENKVAPAYCFQESTIKYLDENINKITLMYANLVTGGDFEEAKKELRLHLREHVVWERNTVWRDMIGIERKANAAHMGPLVGSSTEKRRLHGDDPTAAVYTKQLWTPMGHCTVPIWLFSSSFFILAIIGIIFSILLKVNIFATPEQNNCFAMLVFVSLLWATEVIPLFVTSLLIPFLVVLLRIVRADEKPHERLETKAATKYIFSAMWTPVIMLLLGGFAIAAALSKYGIAKRMATFVLSRAGTRPRTVLVTNMFVAMFASMWISNVAAPVLCFSIIQPLLRNLPANSPFSQALILGIALASNIGGMASPIASPQNIIALENMHPAPSWVAWFFIAIPVCIISILLIWVLLLITFNPGKNTTIVPIRAVKDPFSAVEIYITAVTLVTIALWCASHSLEHVFGDMGVIAIIPLVAFFGTGILTKEDFNNFLWTIIILAAGGLSLGKAVNSSGLLQTIAGNIKVMVEGHSLYTILVIFCLMVLVIATFISHTVAALIILPIVMRVGAAMEEPHPNLLVMGAALMCSAAMGLPTSGFPNMTAIMMEDQQTGERYLSVKHFITRGVPSSLLTFGVVVTVGYGLMKVAGF
ncbi:SPX domain-containing protein [Pyronema omphalodes]|nr:SPX domain-containing protein [Pyronema omphalodes]